MYIGLNFIGFENWCDYIDFSSTDDYGEPIPEYEIAYVNRKQKAIPDIIRELDFLLPFEPRMDIIEEVSNGNFTKICEDYNKTPSKPEITWVKNDFPLECEIINEINGLYGYRYRSKYRKDSIFNFT